MSGAGASHFDTASGPAFWAASSSWSLPSSTRASTRHKGCPTLSALSSLGAPSAAASLPAESGRCAGASSWPAVCRTVTALHTEATDASTSVITLAALLTLSVSTIWLSMFFSHSSMWSASAGDSLPLLGLAPLLPVRGADGHVRRPRALFARWPKSRRVARRRASHTSSLAARTSAGSSASPTGLSTGKAEKRSVSRDVRHSATASHSWPA
mmetsp:Transcript_80126/g.226833  ORF Transcript_80126/g.226833 Transcript_80126/m.226833 type:complete len:212 (-) Transcript_80126:376-1011(-)